MRTRQAATWLVAPALLVAVALLQWWRVAEHDQSSWSGVGFGMFATFEQEAHRRVLVDLDLDGNAVPAEIPPRLLAAADRLRTVPSEDATRSLAERLGALRWRIDDDGGVAVADETGRAPTAVTVVVEGVEVSSGDHPELRSVVVRRVEWLPA